MPFAKVFYIELTRQLVWDLARVFCFDRTGLQAVQTMAFFAGHPDDGSGGSRSKIYGVVKLHRRGDFRRLLDRGRCALRAFGDRCPKGLLASFIRGIR